MNKECIICGSTFTTQYPNQKTCSDSCASENRKQYHKKWRLTCAHIAAVIVVMFVPIEASATGVSAVASEAINDSIEWELGYITTTTNIRERPSEASNQIGQFTVNEEIKYHRLSCGWLMIPWSNGVAYVIDGYVSDVPISPINQIDPAELELLARVIYAESGNQGLQGQRYVAACVLNRVDSPRFPNTITEVLLSPHQFECVSTGAIYRWEPTEETYQAIELELESRSDSNIVSFRTGHFGWGTPAFQYRDHFFSY